MSTKICTHKVWTFLESDTIFAGFCNFKELFEGLDLVLQLKLALGLRSGQGQEVIWVVMCVF